MSSPLAVLLALALGAPAGGASAAPDPAPAPTLSETNALRAKQGLLPRRPQASRRVRTALTASSMIQPVDFPVAELALAETGAAMVAGAAVAAPGPDSDPGQVAPPPPPPAPAPAPAAAPGQVAAPAPVAAPSSPALAPPESPAPAQATPPTPESAVLAAADGSTVQVLADAWSLIEIRRDRTGRLVSARAMGANAAAGAAVPAALRQDRIVDHEGRLVRRTLDASGQVVGSEVVGDLADLPVRDAERTDDGGIVERVELDGRELIVERDAVGRFLAVRPPGR
ncbi:MAG: hypothetical protein QM767_18130 [Anaeromyxobacter sp.]